MGGGGDNLFGTILNVVSFAVPALRPIAIGYNMINAAANDNPLGMLTSAAGAYGYYGDAGMMADAAANVDPSWAAGDAYSAMSDAAANVDPSWLAGDTYSAMGDAASNIDPSWAGTPFEGSADSPFLGSEGLQNAVNADRGAWANIVGNAVRGIDQSLAAPISQEGLGMLSNPASMSMPAAGMSAPTDFSAPTNTFEAGTTENVFNPSTDGYGMGTEDVSGTLPGNQPTTLEGMNSQWGSGVKGEGFQPQKYTYENKDFFTGKTGTGMNLEGNINPLSGKQFTQGLEMNNLPDIFKKLTTSVGGSGSMRAPTPLEWGVKTVGALGNMYNNSKAMNLMERQFNAANNWTDPNRARGDFANQQWQQSFSDPRQAYNEFMGGAGREFTDQARAQAAKSGRRGAYLNSGRMNSDLASMFMKQLPQYRQSVAGGFAGGQNNYAATASAAPGYASMIRNQLQPLGDLFGQYQNFDQTFGSAYS